MLDNFEGKFIMRVEFSDGICIHYIMNKKYLTPALTADSSDYSFLNNLPGVKLSAELINSVKSVVALSIGNGVDYANC